MNDFNLEQEYGSLLDSLAKHISEIDNEPIEHFGVKGMKWGVRKDKTSSTRPQLKSLGPDVVIRKTASGEKITLSKNPPNAIHKIMGRLSKTYREEYATAAYLNISDGSGKKVGEAQVVKKNADELYLLWLGINKSARGKGYATAVMKAAEEFGRQEGFKKMTLEVPGNSKDARHIYEKLGFKFISEVDGGTKDLIWGGLSNMEYIFDESKHTGDIQMSSVKHFGVKGMKWGVRKQKQLDKYTRISQGKGKVLETLRFKANVRIPELISNKGDIKRIAAGRAAILQAQKKRIESGNATKLDAFDRALNTPVIDLIRGR